MKIKKIKIDEYNNLSAFLFSDKPETLIIAGMHGNEKTGVILLNNIVKNLKVLDKKLPIAIIPCVNRHAYKSNTRLNLKDNLDLNRIFPATYGKKFSHKLARTLYKYAKGFSTIIDIHVFPGEHTLLCGVDLNNPDKYLKNLTKKYMEFLGLEVICRMDKKNEPEKGGSLCGLLQESGKIAFGIELPPIEILSFRDQKRIENNFLSFIKNIKNINHKKISFFKRQKYFSKEEGNFSPKVFPGNKVSKGDLVGVLVNKKGERKNIFSPYKGLLISIAYKQKVSYNRRLFVVGKKLSS